MIDVPYGNRELTDLYLLFEKKEDVTAYLEHTAQPSARFHAMDYVDFHTGTEDVYGVARNNKEFLTIKTNANLTFKNNDFIYDIKYGITWRINDYTTADDGQMKENSLRPRKWTIINLVRNNG